jgi:hypothetical protein
MSEVQPRRQLSLFVTDGARTPIEALRQRWDPDGAARIAAYITLLYDIAPIELPRIAEELPRIGQEVSPFRLQLGPVAHWGTRDTRRETRDARHETRFYKRREQKD